MRPLTLQRLEVFRAVYERGGISAAARDLKLTQPTVSRHLRDLEVAIGLTLFEIERGRLRPTSDGDSLFLECRHLKDTLLRLEGRIEALRSGTARTVVVRSIAPLVHEHLPRAISVARERIPLLDLSVDIALAEDQLRALRAGRIDLGLVAGELSTDDCHVERIGSGKLVLLMPSDHALAGRERVDHAEVREACRYVRLHPSGPIGALAAERLGLAADPAGARLTIHSFNLAVGLCETLRSPVIADEFTARAAKRAGITFVPIFPYVEFDILAVSNPLTGRTRARDVLVEALRTSLAST